MPTYSCYEGDNAVLVSKVVELYLKKGQTICDPTWGRGVFWRQVNLADYKMYASDLVTCPEARYDLRHLPYGDAFFDLGVLDPPYAHNPGHMLVEPNYQNAATTRGFYHKDIMNLYLEGMREMKRILKAEAMLLVKCQDEIESSFQRWSHIEIYEMAKRLGFFAKDLFVLKQSRFPKIQRENQKHARKCHSYLWVFKLPSAREAKQLVKFGLT
jgi:DNA modification methylase